MDKDERFERASHNLIISILQAALRLKSRSMYDHKPAVEMDTVLQYPETLPGSVAALL